MAWPIWPPRRRPSRQRRESVARTPQFCRVLQDFRDPRSGGKGPFAVLLFCQPVARAPAGWRLARDRGSSRLRRHVGAGLEHPEWPRRLGRLRRSGHHRPRGSRGGPQASRHVHRVDRPPRPAPPRLRGGRQLRRRGARRPRVARRRHDPPRQLGHRRRRRPRHPGRDHGEGGPARRRGRAHRPARRRQVRRRRRLQGLRRPARRRRLGRQRAERDAASSRSAATATSGARSTSAARRRPTSPRARRASETGTTITFLPDAEIFETLDFDFSILEQRLRETAFLTRGLRISLTDERSGGNRVEFHYEGGIEDFVALPQREQGAASSKKVIFFEGESDEGAVEVAMQWNGSYQESVFSFANNINTHEGGSHLSGFRSALTRTLNRYAREKGLLKEKDDNLSGEDVREGLTAVISAKLADPQFEGQTKTKLGNPGMEGFVATIVNAQAGRVPRGEPGRGAARSSARPSRPPRRAPPPARRATSRAARARWRTRRCRASSPTARSRTRRWRRSSSSRATPPAARPSRGATATPRRSCRCAARSSTSRRRASTRCCRTTRSRR